MRVSIQFDTENAAFEDDFAAEAKHIGEAVADRLTRVLAANVVTKNHRSLTIDSRPRTLKFVLRDTNGNLIGWIVVEVE